jgi:hypothetical protein
MNVSEKLEEANLLNLKDMYGDFPIYDPLVFEGEITPL